MKKKEYRRVGAKSHVIIVRVSEAMKMDLEQMQDTLQMSISDFIRIAVRNAITYYSKRNNQMTINNAEVEEFTRSYQLAMKKDETKSNESVPSDEDIKELLKQRAAKLVK